MEHPHGNALVRLTATFEGQAIATIDWDNVLLFLPQQIGASLEFADPGRFVKKLNEYGLEEGRHTVRFTNGNLATLKAALGPDVIDPRTPSLVLLTEAGLYRALMRSRAKNAEPFQEWLASEVLPQLRKTGSYALTQPALPSPAAAQLALLVDQRERGALTPSTYASELIHLLKRDGVPDVVRHQALDELAPLVGGKASAVAPRVRGRKDSPLAQMRVERGITLRDASAQIGCDYSTLHGYESGKREPTMADLQKIFDVYGATQVEREAVFQWAPDAFSSVARGSAS